MCWKSTFCGVSKSATSPLPGGIADRIKIKDTKRNCEVKTGSVSDMCSSLRQRRRRLPPLTCCRSVTDSPGSSGPSRIFARQFRHNERDVLDPTLLPPPRRGWGEGSLPREDLPNSPFPGCFLQLAQTGGHCVFLERDVTAHARTAQECKNG